MTKGSTVKKKDTSTKDPEPCYKRDNNHGDKEHDQDLKKASVTDEQTVKSARAAVRFKADLAGAGCFLFWMFRTGCH
jgi:hypothetical protein